MWHETHAHFLPWPEATRRDLAFFRERVRPWLHCTRIVRAGDALAGFVTWHDDLVAQLYVARAARGAAVAAPLLRAAEAAIAAAGIGEAQLLCVVGNERARRFYERCGWEHRGRCWQSFGTDGDAAVPYWRLTKTLIPA